MNLEDAVYYEASAVDARLAQLGLTKIILITAAEKAWTAFASCTENHPPAAAGYQAWSEAICSLREQLLPLGWERLNDRMWPLVIDVERRLAISVATGNENTGDRNESPVTTSAKGPRTAGAVYANRRQLFLFPEMLPPIDGLDTEGRSTWLLLLYRDMEARELRLELSRPISMDADNRVDGWAERIILEPIAIDGVPNSLVGGPTTPRSPEISIEIRRRG